MSRNWAYIGMKSWSDKGRIAVKSDQPGEPLNSLGEGIFPREFLVDGALIDGEHCPSGHFCAVYEGSTNKCMQCKRFEGEPELNLIIEPFPVLTNPKKCSIKWYETGLGEELPNRTDIFFPRMSNTKFGDFARLNGQPARMNGNGGGAAIATSQTDFKIVTPEKLEMLYVECRKEIATARLRDIRYDINDFEKLKSKPNREVHVNKIMSNYSPTRSEVEVKFRVDTINSVSLRLNQSFAPFLDVEEPKFQELSDRLQDMLSNIGMGSNSSSIIHGKTTKEEIFEASVRGEQFDYAKNISIPPSSKVTLTAYSKPIKGTIPFTAVYELFPTANTHDLEESLKKFGMDQKIERTEEDTLLVHFDGLIKVDAGHKIDVEIETEKISSVLSYLFPKFF